VTDRASSAPENTMRRLLLAAACVLTIPAGALGAPCVPDTLTNYVGLGGGGCSVGGALFSDFTTDLSLLVPTATPIDASSVTVTPTTFAGGVQLAFSMDQSADADQFLGILIGYTVAGLSGVTFSAAGLSLDGAEATGNGDVSVAEDLCLGDVFLLDPASCPGTSDTLAVAQLPGFSTSPDALAFTTPTSLLDVFVDIAISSNVEGTALLDGAVTTAFTADAAPSAVPEPASLLLVGTGVSALALRRRRLRT
jgi:hypothetical protein